MSSAGNALAGTLADKNAEIARLSAELAAVMKERDNWNAHAVSRGKRLRRARDRFIDIKYELEDEGDRVYFGSSNHADQFKEEVAWLDDFAWDKVIGEPEDWNLLGALEKARAELAAERERAQMYLDCNVSYMRQVDMLREALERAERKLTAYVGVCKGDKELTGTVLPMVRAVLAETKGGGDE